MPFNMFLRSCRIEVKTTTTLFLGQSQTGIPRHQRKCQQWLHQATKSAKMCEELEVKLILLNRILQLMFSLYITFIISETASRIPLQAYSVLSIYVPWTNSYDEKISLSSRWIFWSILSGLEIKLSCLKNGKINNMSFLSLCVPVIFMNVLSFFSTVLKQILLEV